MKLPLLFGEALAEKGDDFFARLHECVLDEGGNTLMHYCVYYDLDVIGSQLLETSGNKWWRLVLQTNKAGRNAIEEARWLDAVGETESPFLVRISVRVFQFRTVCSFWNSLLIFLHRRVW